MHVFSKRMPWYTLSMEVEGFSPKHGSGGARKEAEVCGVVGRAVDDFKGWNTCRSCTEHV